MAGRFVVQKLAASMSSRSRTLLRAHAAASSTTAGGGAASTRRALSHLLHHGSSAIQPAGSSSSGPSAICRIPSNAAYSGRGADRAFSSSSVSSSTAAGREIGAEETLVAWQAGLDAIGARMAARDADFNKFMRKQYLLIGFACISLAVGLLAEELSRRVRKIKSQQGVPGGCCPGCSRPLSADSDMAKKAKAV